LLTGVFFYVLKLGAVNSGFCKVCSLYCVLSHLLWKRYLPNIGSVHGIVTRNDNDRHQNQCTHTLCNSVERHGRSRFGRTWWMDTADRHIHRPQKMSGWIVSFQN